MRDATSNDLSEILGGCFFIYVTEDVFLKICIPNFLE